ncbi:NAD(P)/FAD-dependent oxidoreductase [Bordetella bronchiseptica]|nr:FAD dependent oxidoreductase [Bordetella bronchiseptica 980-2]KCV49088.1 FAD dependent oxidoreductase [Bordetella bronchiseptica 3E44]KCV65050.1 FAD dependent oxidoreductase [Bordetella bronchiseptica 980]KDC41449.1 FAD dependent oxidoreductase [Bordetella bronchiseptica M435/02/3]KDC72389.1 FAD dependent oxidoreductase [Bordetella bronchiseptica MBORD632]SUV72279.1 FAD dependent oxidoreductase [Bordetella bronchiseptica]
MNPDRLLGEPLRLPDSLWAATAPAAPALPSLDGRHVADVLIIGAGFTGLSAAIRLCREGRRVIVLDAAEPGWGASGRNNGQVIAGLKQDPEVIETLYPGEAGRRLVRFGSEAPGVVFRLIDEFGIDCAAGNKGWIQPAFTGSGLRAVERRCQAWGERGVATRLLQADELARLLGTPRYRLGWLDPRGGHVQPLAYARGLARVALSLGATIFGGARAEALRREAGQWLARCQAGEARAPSVIVATGGYADRLVPGLRTSIVPVRTAQVATRVLPEAMRREILPQGHVSSDTRQLLTSFRLSPDGRLVMGGAGATAGLEHARIVPFLHRAGAELFAHLGKLDWEYHWSGYFAVTTDHLPHVHEPAAGMHVSLGCNGRGIAISTALGIELAERVLGAPAESLSVPVSDLRSVRLHGFRHLGVAAATRYKRLQDRLAM